MGRPDKKGADDGDSNSAGRRPALGDGAAQATATTEAPQPAPDSAEEDSPTVNVEVEPGLLNDPRRVVVPKPADADDPTRQVFPEGGLVNAPHRVGAPAPPSISDPTLNVSPDPGLHNDPNRVLRAREELHRIPTVTVSPDLGVLNDPNRLLRAREEEARAPTMSVTPDLAVLNDARRLPLAISEPPTSPVVSAVREPAMVLPASSGALVWVREEPPQEETVNKTPTLNERPDPAKVLTWPAGGGAPREATATTDPDPNVMPREATATTDPDPTVMPREATATTDPDPTVMPREPSVRTDPDPTGAEIPWASLDPESEADSTRKLDLSTGASLMPPNPRPSMKPAGAVPPPRPSMKPPAVSAPRPPRASPRLGVAPLVPIGSSVLPPPAESDTAARTDPNPRPPLVPLSVLAEPSPGARSDETRKPPSGTEAWRNSPEVQAWHQEPADDTRIMSAAAPKGLRPPRLRDVLVISLGFVLVCVAMLMIRKGTKESVGPLPAQKIKPPSDYVAPKPVKVTEPYVAPRPEHETVPAPSSPSSSGSAATPAAAGGATETRSPVAAAAAPSNRIANPRCAVNVPQVLETKAAWVVDGKRRLLRLRATPKRQAIMKVNLFVANAFEPEKAELVRTENAAVWFDTFLDPEANASVVKVMLDCECGIATAQVQATIDMKALDVDLKYASVGAPEVMASKSRRKR